MAHLLLPAVLGLPGLIGGIMSAIEAGKRLHGGRIRRLHPLHKAMGRGGRLGKRRVHKKRAGRGIAADIVGGIPLLGAIAGPLVRALGGRVRHRRMAKHRGRGLVPMHIYQPIAYGAGLIAPGPIPRYAKPDIRHMMMGITSSGKRIPIMGGLLSPTGVGGSMRRGHYRYVHGKRIHVGPTIVHGSGGKIKRRHYRRRK